MNTLKYASSKKRYADSQPPEERLSRRGDKKEKNLEPSVKDTAAGVQSVRWSVNRVHVVLRNLSSCFTEFVPQATPTQRRLSQADMRHRRCGSSGSGSFSKSLSATRQRD